MTLPNVREHEDGWLQVKIPLPYPLKWVNAYLLPGEEGWTLIDPGLHTSDAKEVWTETLRDTGIGWHRIVRIVLTHHHPDHYGLAGWFQQRTGAPVWMSGAARETAERMWGAKEKFTDVLPEAFRAHGLPAELADEMELHLLGFRERVSPKPTQIVAMTAGTVFRMARREWELVGGEGHAPGHISFYDRKSKRLICGDQVLPDISPNIGWMPGGDPDPLGSFLDTMRSLVALEVEIAYPGHREPFGGFRERVTGLLEHHKRRLVKILEGIGVGSVNSFEVCEELFGDRLRGDSHLLRFALAETIAHLVYLEKNGELKLEPASGGEIRYRK